MPDNTKTGSRSTWLWVPSLYFAEGIPYVLVMTLSVIFYKRMGISNTDIALYTSWLYFPWVFKWVWSPLVDMIKTKRWWIVIMQLFIGAGLAGVALSIPGPDFFKYTMAFFWLLAFSSATHDIAADGFYMLGLTRHDQAFFVGIRSTFYRLAMLTGQGLLVILAGFLESKTGLTPVEVAVHAAPVDSEVYFQPDRIAVSGDDSDSYFVSDTDIVISTKKQSFSWIGEVLDSMEQWNVSHGFYAAEASKTQNSEEQGWWQKNISGPLEVRLERAFAGDRNEKAIAHTGNIGYTYFHLSRPPEQGEKVVLNFTHNRGDKSIALVKSYRYEFTAENWNIPAIAAFQIDPKLDKEAGAIFVGLSGNIAFAWTTVFVIIAIVFALFFIYHRFVLPRPEGDRPNLSSERGFLSEFFTTFAAFFRKKEIGIIIAFLLVYRLGESQLVKLASPFLLDSREMNGLGLTTGEIGLIYGTVGIIALSLGGIIGGIAASRRGLKYWLWWMVGAMNLPNLVYVFLSFTMPDSLWIVGASVAIEQFGYGFGFTAYMLYMIYVSDGKHKTAHYAITTGFMAFGMMIPGMISGWLQEIIGYQNFFIWVMLCTIPGFLIVPFLKIDPSFGVKQKDS